ncbi:MAG: tetratricopeptide repeat protein [Phycisphaerales bacterium]|nr:MAG: tetratricopeptide repeat protein [Phycisphaerales bacterium]
MTIPKDVERLLATLLQLRVDEAIVAKAREILGHKAEDIGEWIELAVALREREEFDAALAAYDAAIQRFPDSHVLWSNRGFLLLIWELYEEALKNFSKAMEIRPDYVHALAHKAAAHERLHEFEKAVTDYRAVLELEPGHARAWNSLGVCLRELGNEEEAIQCYEESTTADPTFTDPLFNLAALYSTHREYTKAIPYVSRLLEIDPHDFRAIKLRDEILKQPEEPRGISVRDQYVKRTDPTSPGPEPPRNILYKSDGTRRPNAEIVREQGKIGLRMALLDDAMHQRLDSGETCVIYPLRLFLSYKWGTEAENEWVATLAGKLAERGWDVVFDRYRDETVDRSVESFVSRIATCRVFLAVATPKYVAHGVYPCQPSWVFDEYQVAMSTETGMYRIALAPEGKLLVPEGQDVIFRRSDTVDPSQFGIPAITIQENKYPHFDEIYAIPANEDLDKFLDEYFAYDGPRLDDNERSQIVKTLEEIQSDGQEAEVAVGRLREVLAQYPFVFDAWRRLVLKLTEVGRLSEAVDALEVGIQHVHPWDERLMLERERLDLLNQLGRTIDAVKAALQILETRPRDWVAHFYMGNRLDDCSELWAARNHLLIACNNEHAAAEAFNTLGVVYLGLGFLLRARQCFEGALQKDATLERAKRNLARTWEAQTPHDFANTLQVKGPGLGCTVCPAMYPTTQDLPVVCIACGGRRPASGKCPYCTHDCFVLWSDKLGELASVSCPTCRIGSLTKKLRFDL